MEPKNNFPKFDRRDLEDFASMIFRSKNPEKRILKIIFAAGTFYFLLAVGALLGFVLAYNSMRLKEKKIMPLLKGKPQKVYNIMMVCSIITGLLPLFLLLFYRYVILEILGYSGIATFHVILTYLLVNFIFSYIGYRLFVLWQVNVSNFLNELNAYGSAEFAQPEDSEAFKKQEGLYIGNGHYYNKRGHILTVGGTRGGKGVNLIVPNLLKTGKFKGSFVVLDPKGEIAAITAEAQRKMGRNVVILNPWEMLSLGSLPFNPLDILKNDRLNLSDDVLMIAETIVPIPTEEGPSAHFTNKARAMIETLLLHLVTSDTIPDDKRHLGTLWQWLRLPSADWLALLKEMTKNNSEAAGDIVKAGTHEILQLMDKGEKEYSGIISGAQKWTAFLKSPALRKALSPEPRIKGETFVVGPEPEQFNSADLSDGNTTVYVIIPADRLKTHYQWLRLVVSALMRSVIRNPQKDVCFLLDECYALGYLSEIDTALGAYAGYGVHVWAIFQNLTQIQNLYGKNWEGFTANCSVRHFFNINDNTTSSYISEMFGRKSYETYDKLGNIKAVVARNLINPDELRRTSDKIMYTVIDSLAPARFPKLPYYEMPNLRPDDYAPNPYYKGN